MKNKLTEKIILEEPEDVEVAVDELPPAEPSEPIEISVDPVPEEELKVNAISGIITNEIAKVYSDIDSLKSILSTVALEMPDRQDVLDILNELINERTIHIGMFQQLLDLVDGEHKDLVDAGAETAKAIAGEPEANELN